MFNIVKESIEWGGRTLTIETGRMARQAGGSALVTYGDTIVLVTATRAPSARSDVDFLPLTVNYVEKTYAAGKIPGGFFKREGRPSEKETLTSRLIDRPIRPLFPKGYHFETQIVATVLSFDLENDSDVPAMIGASAACALAGLPLQGWIAGSRVGYIDGQYVLNPTLEQIKNTDLNLMLAGTKDAVLMVESEASGLSEEVMLGSVIFGHDACVPVIDLIEKVRAAANRPVMDFVTPAKDAILAEEVKAIVGADLETAYSTTDKQSRVALLEAARAKVLDALAPEGSDDERINAVKGQFKSLEKKIVRGRITRGEPRIDGRAHDQVRPIVAEASVLPRAHGSALFTRGETQGLVICTLGTGDDEQIIDALEGSSRRGFLFHYNFPPFSTGEVKRMISPGRREIGHGKLAERAVAAVLPGKEAFPYTIRVVSEILESNGSSSMASVCGASMALMDAGVPIKAPVAGIAMGLILEEDGSWAVISDILGDEDHLGDMDFKVAGTADGITALQMDIKVAGITREIMAKALDQARGGRLHILGEMAKGIDATRPDMSDYAPRIVTIKIPVDKIREVIGTGGKVIRSITEECGVKIDIQDDGTIFIASPSGEALRKGQERINAIVSDIESGQVFEGKVVRIMEFGAFVNLKPGTDGLVHISELSKERVKTVTDVVNEGDVVKVKVLDVDPRTKKIRLSMKALLAD
ncbi:MAG: polyribonucleotide nucleotidyltransferase [Alphaproteobacteria bacterium CG_4_10_14_0_2_um_filter_63_37]|nr:MAG: polyribonucleotide nucleotidyltransferase [Proteobacteria bacterium CG1_02_64_396]PJA25110.1 MAG: polyribonucleotide nucleotidyltransferase [Alphaproteobacteria bacterium CG_4_10_14_0_2_um_filter_63_37]